MSAVQDDLAGLDDVMPLTELVDHLPSEVTYDRLRRWSDTDRDNNFPEPVERLGKIKFYDRKQVVRWVHLWLKTDTSKNMSDAALKREAEKRRNRVGVRYQVSGYFTVDAEKEEEQVEDVIEKFKRQGLYDVKVEKVGDI